MMVYMIHNIFTAFLFPSSILLPPLKSSKHFILSGSRHHHHYHHHHHHKIFPMRRSDFARYEGVVNLKGLIVDEEGLDVFYWRKLMGERASSKSGSVKKSGSRIPITVRSSLGSSEKISVRKFDKGSSRRTRRSRVGSIETTTEERVEEISVPEVSLLRGNSSSSSENPIEKRAVFLPPAPQQEPPKASIAPLQEATTASTSPPQEPPKSSIAPPEEPTKASASPPQAVSLAIQSQPEKVAPPKPPPPPQLTSSKAPPPPPPVLPRRPPKAADSASSFSKPPPPPLPLRPSKTAAKVEKDSFSPSTSGGSSVAGDQVKMKPLHWEKFNIDAEHSMVWNKINGGSFRVDGDLMEALFGSAATNRKPIQEPNPKTEPSKSADTKIFFLDIRKSQNIAIILRSLGVPQNDIFQALDDGHGLIAETIERLNQITVTKEEQSRILRFDGDVSRLADAESFLYRLLKAYPSAFARFNAMLFKLNYDSEVAQLKESIKVMELGCRELRRGGVFVKLLEAILKAGNRMNAGTARGDAAAFNLNSLKTLSDVKSSDGKTTLLHFVVEEVVRSEGKRNRTGPASTDSDMVLGLAVVGGLGVEFLNVKKAAGIDFKSASASASGLSSRLIGYRREMGEFLVGAEEELESVRRTQVETLELVKKTTEYYQAGGGSSREDNPLQIFVVVKDFLGMVNKVCAEISRDLQRKNVAPRATAATTTTTPAAAPMPPVKFMNLPAHFVSEKSNSTSDDSDTEF